MTVTTAFFEDMKEALSLANAAIHDGLMASCWELELAFACEIGFESIYVAPDQAACER